MQDVYKRQAFIRSATGYFAPEVGIVLGTGLGDFADRIETRHALDYKDIPGFPVSTVEGHKGRLIFGEAGGRRVVAMQGRFHYYEGYTICLLYTSCRRSTWRRRAMPNTFSTV